MTTKEQVESFMLKYFPKCPLCGADKGYEVSGWGKTYVQCRSCGAKWQSTDFVRCEELKELQLWESSYEGEGASLKRKTYSVKFWQDSEAIENAIKGQDLKSKAELVFRPEMTDQQLEALIKKSLHEITQWDYGSTRHGKLAFLFSDASLAEAATIRLLRAIFEENKILIIQTELLRRALAKTKKQTSN